MDKAPLPTNRWLREAGLYNFSRSQYARGGLPDRAINTLKADHSPRLARWIVIQRERL
jgi:hypothetical protein